LQDHRDPLASDMPHLGVGLLHEILALEQHPAFDDLGRRGQHAQNGEGQGALAGAGLADDS